MYKENYKLKGKRAFITGGGRGIGLCSADALAEAGASIVISDIDEKLLEEGMSSLRSKNYQVEGFLLDVANSSATEEIAEQVEGKLGPVDILVANAGIAGPDTPAENLTDEAWHRIMKVNLDGVFWSCRAFGKRMLERRQGVIVTVGSMSGFISNEPQKQVDYNASKAALHHLTRSLAG
jgi:NAD(P)-dependent dehydrogenase (short-subunit alcohol dehydrogenase family)